MRADPFAKITAQARLERKFAWFRRQSQALLLPPHPVVVLTQRAMKRDAIVVFVGCWALALGWLSTLAMSDDTAKPPAAATSAAATSTAATSATASSTAATSASAAVPDSPPGADAGAGATDDDDDAKPAGKANDAIPPPLPELGEGPKSVLR